MGTSTARINRLALVVRGEYPFFGQWLGFLRSSFGQIPCLEVFEFHLPLPRKPHQPEIMDIAEAQAIYRYEIVKYLASSEWGDDFVRLLAVQGSLERIRYYGPVFRNGEDGCIPWRQTQRRMSSSTKNQNRRYLSVGKMAGKISSRDMAGDASSLL